MNAIYLPSTVSTWRPPDHRRLQRGIEELRVTDAINIGQFLRSQGLATADAERLGRKAIEDAKLTRPGKTAFVASKRDAAVRVIAATFLRACSPECVRIDRAGEHAARAVITVPKTSCEVCHGSNNGRAAITCARVLKRKGITRVVLVGGTPKLNAEMKELFGGTGIEIRYVDGTHAGHTLKDAEPNKSWAQLLVIWGPTPLRHSVSDLYTTDVPEHARIVKVSRRGIEALCREVEASYT